MDLIVSETQQKARNYNCSQKNGDDEMFLWPMNFRLKPQTGTFRQQAVLILLSQKIHQKARKKNELRKAK